jgi:DNA polymerase-3 subunit epsilon
VLEALGPIVFLDLEATGGSTAFDRIIEIGLVEVDRGRVVGEWSTLVNPGRRIPPAIQSLTGITEESVADAPTFGEISEALAQRLDGKVLAAHNARFDYGFLRSEFRRAGVHYRAPVLCTVKLSRRLQPHHPRHNLDALLVRHAIFCLDRHRALGDARVLWELAQIWHREHGEAVLKELCAELLRPPVVPPGLPDDVFDDLPETPGVYVFHGADGAVLYVGRSANIRSRVLAHFASTPRPRRDLRIDAEVTRIEWIETAGELGACFRAAQLERTLRPRYNRSREREAADEPCSWHWRAETHTAPPQLVTASEVGLGNASDLYGVFRSRAAALQALREIAKARRLCRRLLGLETADEPGACSAHAQAHCRGACIGAESALSHAMRLAQALAALRVRPWPYAGRIAIRERDAASGRAELHVLDRWRYVATVYTEAELHELGEQPHRSEFDVETYRLLVRFLKAPVRGCEIIPLAPNVAAAYA